MSSYQKLKARIKELELELANAHEFERMMKNLIRAIRFNQPQEIEDTISWFKHNSNRYTVEVENWMKGGKQ